MMSNNVAKTDAGIPAHLAQYQKSKIGNVDSTDRIIPRVKLMQAISPELVDFPEAKAGQFWHTIAQQNMGPTIRAVPIIIRKSFVLWAPRNDDRGILARAMDGIHWDPADAEFTVKPKGSPNPVTYRTKGTVAESGLDKFGTSIPGDANSPPAASLTYNMMWHLVDFPELSPSIIINTRSSVKPMQQLLSRIDSKPVPHFTPSAPSSRKALRVPTSTLLTQGPDTPTRRRRESAAKCTTSSARRVGALTMRAMRNPTSRCSTTPPLVSEWMATFRSKRAPTWGGRKCPPSFMRYQSEADHRSTISYKYRQI
jgi:hypothetical protein